MAPVASFKLCIFGDSRVGKTTLTHRYVTDRFIQDTKATLGVDIVSKDIEINGDIVKLQIWDFGGEIKFRSFLPVYARGSSGGIFMYDITRKETLDHVAEWLSIFRKHAGAEDFQVPILIVGGKRDLKEYRRVSIEDAIDQARNHNMYEVIECSSKTGENVEEVFQSITRKLYEIHQLS
ncbi:MAG: GTP-binding protein [Promethearchaeota archaeon]|nr:MAG: GTP-binding protein [Candidatus Lokiarchaeota archaeon]